MSSAAETRVAVVTGASRGIGRAIAEELGQAGWSLTLAARSEDLLRQVAAGVAAAGGPPPLVVATDLRRPEAPGELVSLVEERFGRLDLVVNNAGATKRGDFFSLSEADWQDGFALKFFGNVRLTRAAWPLLKAAGGSVVNIVGVGGRTPGAEFAIGGSVNAGLLSFTKAMAAVGTRDGVRVNAVNPGPIATDRLRGRIQALAEARQLGEAAAAVELARDMGVARFGEPAEVAALVAFLASERAGFIHGALIDIDGGLTRTL